MKLLRSLRGECDSHVLVANLLSTPNCCKFTGPKDCRQIALHVFLVNGDLSFAD